MKLLEHEAKTLLQKESLPTPDGMVITKITDASILSTPIVLKSQVPTGGRGKLGGVVITETADEARASIDQLFALSIKGFTPTVLLAEEKLSITAEHYVSLLVDRNSEDIRLIAHKSGGIEVEDNKAADFLNIPITAATLGQCSSNLAAYLGYDTPVIEPFLAKLYAAFVKNDALLIEINPLIYTADHNLVCGDCKMELDDAASFRHPEWDFEDKPADANFVVLDPKGTVATIANGAGLAMATVDAVAAEGMKPANFLDVGGGANLASVLNAFERIAEFSSVQAIVINIFAGITRCDEVAKAIIEARKQIDDLPPLFIRLAGTNFEQAVELLTAEEIPTLATLEECLDAAKEVVHE